MNDQLAAPIKRTKITIATIAAAVIILAAAGIAIAIAATNNSDETIANSDASTIIDANEPDNSSVVTDVPATSEPTEAATEVPATGPTDLLPVALISGILTTAATYLYFAKK